MDHINNELPACSLFTGDFNHIVNTNSSAIDTIASSAGYKQIIKKPTHTVNHSIMYFLIILR